jgi:hypothetical protein
MTPRGRERFPRAGGRVKTLGPKENLRILGLTNARPVVTLTRTPTTEDLDLVREMKGSETATKNVALASGDTMVDHLPEASVSAL